jgi:predicted phosphodiesterase
MLQIQIVSDIHAEFWGSKKKFDFIKPSASILALLGDICCCGTDDDFEIFKRFITELLPSYEHIIFVPGNHEYYYNSKKSTPLTMDKIDAKIKAFFKTSKKLHFLNNNSMKLTSGKSTYLIVGSTLWSWIPEEQREYIQKSMNDYQFIYTSDSKKIRNITSTDIANQHLANYRYIRSQVAKAKKANYKVIVFTHHKPYHSKSYDVNTNSAAYESDLTSIIKSPIVLWAYGHTHIYDDSYIGTCRMFSNPKGYPRQQTKFNKAINVKV